MSQENVELTHRSLDAFNRHDLAAVLALMDDDVESDSLIVAIEGGYHGHDGVRRLWEDAHNAVPDLTIEAVEVRDLGDLTVATRTFAATARVATCPSIRRSGTSAGGGTGSASGGRLPQRGRSPRSRRPVGARRSRRLLSLRDTARAMSQENVELVRFRLRRLRPRRFRRRRVRSIPRRRVPSGCRREPGGGGFRGVATAFGTSSSAWGGRSRSQRSIPGTSTTGRGSGNRLTSAVAARPADGGRWRTKGCRNV